MLHTLCWTRRKESICHSFPGSLEILGKLLWRSLLAAAFTEQSPSLNCLAPILLLCNMLISCFALFCINYPGETVKWSNLVFCLVKIGSSANSQLLSHLWSHYPQKGYSDAGLIKVMTQIRDKCQNETFHCVQYSRCRFLFGKQCISWKSAHVGSQTESGMGQSFTNIDCPEPQMYVRHWLTPYKCVLTNSDPKWSINCQRKPLDYNSRGLSSGLNKN